LDGRSQLTIQNSGEGVGPALSLEPVNKAKKINSIDTWLQAFHVFVGIYASKYPQEDPGLIKYGATRGHNWRFYDEKFRYLKQMQATSLPWGSIHWELWLHSQNNLNTQRTPPAGGSRKPISPLCPVGTRSIRVAIAQDVFSSTHVLNVRAPIGPSTVIFVPLVDKSINQSWGSSKPSIKPSISQPLTPPVTNTHKQ